MNQSIFQNRIAERVAEVLRQTISHRHRPGEKLETVRQLSRRYSVSANTMGAALAILAREGLVKVIQGSGVYVAERSTFQKLVPRIALFTEIDMLYPALSRFSPRLFRELKRYFHAAGYPTRVYTGERLPNAESQSRDVFDDLLTHAARGEIGGVVAMNSSPHLWDWAQRLADLRVPLVGDMPKFTYCVEPPIEKWISIAVHHLASLGRRRIAMVGWWSQPRYVELFRREMAGQGLSFRPEWVRGDLHPNSRGSGWADLREVWTSHREKPDGLIITDDLLVPDACVAINDLGLRVPEQLTVVAHSNKGCPFFAPLPVTRLEYDPDAQALAVGQLMLKLVRGEPVAEPHMTPDARFALRLHTDQLPVTSDGSSPG